MPHQKSDPTKLQRVILACFFASGACGLIYQIAWLRVMGLVFGSTTLATCTVLAGYMAGLGFGALYFGKKSENSQRPVRLYAFLELGVGLYAFITPFLWKLMEWLCVGFYHWIQPGFWQLSIFRFILAFAFLLFPTFLMGGTLPVIIQQFVKSKNDTAHTVGKLYAINTAGAVLGVYLAGFYLLWILGVWQTTLLTGLLNLIIFFACRHTSRSLPDLPHPSSSPQINAGQAHDLKKVPLFLLTLFGLSGAVSMFYEIGWTRVLAMSLGSSVYAFSTMLATFLLGIALGSWLFSFYAKRFRVTLSVFAFLEIITAILVLIGLNQFNHLPFHFIQLFSWSHGKIALLDFARFALCASVMLPPTLCIGALFSCFMHVYRRSEYAGADVGQAYFANTLGTIAGSVLTGFLFIPLLGIQKTLIVGAWLNAAVGFAVIFIGIKGLKTFKNMIPFISAFVMVLAASLAVTPWNQTLIASDTAIHPERSLGMTEKTFIKSMKERETLFYKEGASATVTVTKIRDNLSLAVNGKTDASTEDMYTQFLLGHLPFFANPNAKKVLVIGLGSASTLTAVASHPVKQIDAVELEKEVITAAGFFGKINRDVLKDPRVHMHHNDGRNFLLLRPEKYDIIISEPSNPWMAGVANLFSLEHYQTTRKRLSENGVVCQWLHAYSMSTEDLQMIIGTFSQVFPHTTLWTSYYPDLMLIGSEKPVTFDDREVRAVMSRPHVSEDFKSAGIDSSYGFFSNFWLSDSEIKKLSLGAKINSDNRPYLEFSAPHYLYQATHRSNLDFLNRFAGPSLPEVKNVSPPLSQNAELFRSLAKGYLAKKFVPKAESALALAEKIEPGNIKNLLLAAELLIAKLENARAEKLIAYLLQKNGKDPQVHYLTGLLAEKMNRLEAAYIHLQLALRSNPGNRDYLKAYFKVVCESGRHEEAIQLFPRLGQLQLETFDLLAPYAMLIFQKAKPEIQAGLAMELINRYPKFPAGYLRLADLYVTARAYPQALSVYAKMARALPLDGEAHLGMSIIQEKIGNKSEAEKARRKAFEIDPTLRTRLAQ